MTRVQRSEDAGTFYCAHVFYLAQLHARELGCCITDDELRVGFLHTPRDDACYVSACDDQAARLEETVRVVERALDGWRAAERVLLTGFGPFKDVLNNPTGALVDDDDIVARLRERLERAGRELIVARLDVDDRALDPEGARSIQALISRHRPDAVLMMGVGRDAFDVETLADDRGLEGTTHVASQTSARNKLAPNLSLLRALGLS